ncbi:hypothetical protein DQK33_19750 [Salmonella enterica subsp. enterica serovar Adamstua]|nr:hypothetical protein [Salmonella enterica subsp. enterica]EBS4510208.1 hypothetical protein [Salmonella enterica subsp. enterica serovar Adamstua]
MGIQVNCSKRWFGMVAVSALFILSSSLRADMLTFAQQSYLEQVMRTQIKNDSDFQSIRAEWTEAHKVAEFLCRPVALNTLRKTHPEVDKVFLGDGKNGGLTLLSSSLLTGTGQYRAGGINWVPFSFQCALSPSVGTVTGFTYRLNASAPSVRVMAPGPVVRMSHHMVRSPL